MNFDDIARIVLDVALAARARERIALTVAPTRIDLIVYDPERARRIGGTRIEETGYRINDHRVTVELIHGIVRIIYIHPAPGHGPATRDQRVALDDADEAVVGVMVRRAIAEGLTPF